MTNVSIICDYKNGERGTLVMESVDKESGRPYAWIRLESGKHEVFFEGEWKHEQ
jgi:hypothetical protein